MKEPDYDSILKAKVDYYGETKAAYQFAAEEFARQEVAYSIMFGSSGSLLEKYIKHVMTHEGINFIDKIHSHSDDVHFTDEEIKILNNITDNN